MEINYRYLVCSELNWRGEKKLIVEQFESTVHPRKFVSSTAVKGSSPVVVEDGEFGTTRRGEHSIDDGWLQHVSELQLHLHSSTEQGIRLEGDLQADEYKIKISSTEYRGDMNGPVCSPKMKMKKMKLSTGDCVVYGSDDVILSVTENEILVFSARLPEFSNCAFIVDIFSSKDDQFLGRSSILPQHLKDDAGRLILTVFNKEMLPVGVIQLDFIIVHPLEHDSVHNISKIFTKQWNKTDQYVDIGHRGMGCSYDHSQEHGIHPAFTENTISSFREVTAHGAELIEFDVQLTADLVPVVFHDFAVCTAFSNGDPSALELYHMKIKDLTLSQLRCINLYHEEALSECNCEKHKPELSLSKPGDQNSIEKRIFPVLDELFQHLPSNIGFNIEVKYPSPTVDGQETFSYFSLNLMADILIENIYKWHDDERKIVLSCFNPDMCTVLRLKQPRFPVFYLTCTERHTWRYADVRAQTLMAALAYAKSQDIPGVCSYSKLLLEQPHLIKAVRDQDLILMTFGPNNNTVDSIGLQKKCGVNGVIYDIWKVPK